MSHSKILTVSALLLSVTAAAPATAQDSSRATELYHIFDIRTTAARADVIRALQDGMNPNISQSDTMTPLVMGTPPETPARFTLVNPLEGTPLGGLIPASQMAQVRQVRCDDAVWISSAIRKVRGSQQLRITMCLFPYFSSTAQGYHLDVHAIDIKEKGGGLSAKIGRAIGTAIVGDSSGWTNKTIIDTLRNVQRQLSPAISYVEGQPAFTGTPWLDPVQLAPSTTDKATQENGAPPAIPTPPAQPK